MTDQYKERFKSELNQFDINSTLNTAKSQFNNFSQSFNNYDISHLLQNISNYQNTLDQVLTQASEFIRFNFSTAEYNQALEGVNNLTMKGGIYCTFQNISALNVSDPRLTLTLNPIELEALNQTKHRVIELNIQYNATIQRMNNISAMITQTRVYMANVNVLVNSTEGIRASIMTTPSSISAQLDNLFNNVLNVKGTIINIIDTVDSAVHGLLTDTLALLSCKDTGTYVRSVGNAVCQQMTSYIMILAIMCGLIGLTMAISFPVFCVTCKRLTYSKQNMSGDKDPAATIYTSDAAE